MLLSLCPVLFTTMPRPSRNFAPKPPLAHVSEVWSDAALAAVQFWERVADDKCVSEAFRLIAGANREVVRRLAARLG